MDDGGPVSHSDVILDFGQVEFDRTEDGKEEAVYLCYKNLTEIPHYLFKESDKLKLKNIKHLYLKRNLLTTIPEEISKLVCLTEISLHSNKLQRLPDGLCSLKNLKILDVSANQLTCLPATIGQLHALEKLHVSYNQLTTLPKEIGNLQNLEVVEAVNNKFRELPLCLCKCSRLKRLFLDKNMLMWLPSQMCKMPCLEDISLSGNQLLCLPPDIGTMARLKHLYVDSNPYLHCIPVTVSSQELGFYGCGSQNYDPGDNSLLQSVTIDHTDSCSKRIFLPREIHHMGDNETHCVPRLLELCLRKTSQTLGGDVAPGHLPDSIRKMLQTPTCYCCMCSSAMFTSGFPMVFEGQIRLYSLYKLALCCSQRCVKLAATVVVNLPLIYPSPSDLCLGLALIIDGQAYV